MGMAQMTNESTPHLGMYSHEGNVLVALAVETLLPTLDAMGRSEAGLPDQFAFADMLRNQLVLDTSPEYFKKHLGESGDTAVRESAWELMARRLIESYGWTMEDD